MSTHAHLMVLLLMQAAIGIVASNPTSKSGKGATDRSGRGWHPLPDGGVHKLQQHQQSQPAVFLATSTNQPADNSVASFQQQHDSSGSSRNFEDQDKSAMPAASEQDFFSRHFGFMNAHRFDPYYDRHQFPRYPSPHMPRFGPGYRKDKYGHGYGYSCKQGDDCDEVRAANQVPPLPPAHVPHPLARNPGPHFGPHFPDMAPFGAGGPPSMPPYGSPYPPLPGRFPDPHAQPSMPSGFYNMRYVYPSHAASNKETPRQHSSDS